MQHKKIVRHYGGGSKVAKVLGVTRQAVHAWGVRGRIPTPWQLRIEVETDGKFKADRRARREAKVMASYLQNH